MGLFSFLKKKVNKDDTTSKYVKGMEKSRTAFASRLDNLTKKYRHVDHSYFEELEEILIEADVGVELTLNLIDKVAKKVNSERISDPDQINEMLLDEMFESYVESGDEIVNEIQFRNDGPTVLLVVGVNGVGKTTSIAKLAKRYLDKGKSVLLVAADTFRAGATEQLTIWSERLNCPIVKGAANTDPASVAYDGAKYAKEHNIDLVIVDTAGRLQTKANLMDELSKISRVISKEIPNSPSDTFLVLDGTTGQNGVIQAKAFIEATSLTGIVVTKMDGTSKGGIILSIREELGVPVRFIGLGEGMNDLEEFDLKKYLYGLLLGNKDE